MQEVTEVLVVRIVRLTKTSVFPRTSSFLEITNGITGTLALTDKTS